MPDPQIVFLLSLPRAGSTLLQRLLMGSGVCNTVGEPSFLLRLLGEGDPIVRTASYWERLVTAAYADMRAAWPGFDDGYRQAVRDFSMHLYRGLAEGKPFFIDKTPRYNLIAREIVETFPEAKVILLWRHPMAVMHSMSTTFCEGRWASRVFEADFHHGIDSFRTLCESHRDRIHQVRYEDLVRDPAGELARLGHYLGIPDLERQADRELEKSNRGKLGDPTGVKKYSKVSSDSVSAWQRDLNWFRSAWAKGYFSGDRGEFFKSLGYELPADVIHGGAPARWLDGLRDWRYSQKILHRRILRPMGRKNVIRREAMQRGYHLLHQ